MGTPRVYVYGLKPPTQQAERVDDQMRLGTRYYNDLTRINWRLRKIIREVLQEKDSHLGPLVTAHAEAEAAYKAAQEEVRALRKRTRCRADTAEQRARVRELGQVCKAARTALKEARQQIDLTLQQTTRLEMARNKAQAEKKEAQHASGLAWGTYQMIDEDVDRAAQMTKLWKKDAPHDPGMRDGARTGIAVHIQNRVLTTEQIMAGTDQWIRISLRPPQSDSKSAQRRRFGTVQLRVGSDEQRQPIWAEWPLLMHRPLPAGAQITWAKVHRRKVADRTIWELHITFQGGVEDPVKPRGNGVLAVNFGWRKMYTGSLRAAYWRDEDGTEGFFELDPAVISGLRKVDSLRSIRDRSRNELRAHLTAWLRERDAVLPPWLRGRTNFIHTWKSSQRFYELCTEWEEKRWDDDTEGFRMLHTWRQDDRHLWRWEANQRQKSLRRRLHQYRNIAYHLASRYSTLLIDDFNMRDTQRHVATESEKIEIEARRLQQKETAPSILRGCLKQAFLGRQQEVLQVPAGMNTQRCHHCGCEERWDAAPNLDRTCPQCGETWDQDANNVRNLLHRLRERGDDVQGVTTQRQAKWAKRGRHKDTAREESPATAESVGF